MRKTAKRATRRISIAFLAALLLCGVMPMRGLATPSSGLTTTPVETPGESPVVTPEVTATSTPAQTPTPADTPILTAAPEETASPEPSAAASATPEPTDSAAPAATPTPTPTATLAPTPTPAPTHTPTPTPTAEPTPTPSLAPAVTFAGEDKTVTYMDTGFDPLNGVSAADADGNPLPVEISDLGGFTVEKEGIYRVVYAAQYAGQTYTHTRRLTVEKSAEQEKYKVIFTLPEKAFKVNSSKASLLEGAGAADENGNVLTVRVSDEGGFTLKEMGSYTVQYAAVHPVLKNTWYGERTVRVLGTRDYNDYVRENNPLKGDSQSRYKKYARYRDDIYAELSEKMQTLTEALQSRAALLATAFPEATRVSLAYPEMALQDDSELTQGEQAETVASDAFASAYSPQDTVLVEVETLAVRNWSDILAVFVAMSSLETDDPLDLYNLRKISFDGLDSVFFDMCTLSYHMDDATGALWIMLRGAPYTDMVARYGMSEEKQAQLEELMQPEFQLVFASLTGDPAFAENVALSPQEQALLEALPQDLGALREQVVTTACTLVDKVSYFWGGKSYEPGWNALWGVPQIITSTGSKTTGKVRPYGMDCSGFVLWSFITAAENADMLELIGSGTATQWGKSTALGWDEAQPGDLAFYTRPGSESINHVGIVLSKADDGTYQIVHCSSKDGGVVITEAWSSGFRYMRRPLLYGEDQAS